MAKQAQKLEGLTLPDGYYSVKQTSEMTGYSESQLRRLDNSGQVQPTRIPYGKSNYRAYTSADVEYLFTLKNDDFKRKALSLMNQLGDLYSEQYGFYKDGKKVESRSIDVNFNKENKHLTVSITFQSQEARDALNKITTRNKDVRK